MAVVQHDRGTAERTDDLRTLHEIAKTYLSHRSPQIMLGGLGFIALVRMFFGGGYGLADLVVVTATAVLVGPVEWVLHLYLLHAPEDSIRMQKFGTGSGHREHHLDPNNVGWALLGGIDAFVFLFLIAGWTAAWSLPIAWILGGGLLGPFLTALAAAYLSLAHYEWTHLLVHTRYRPKSRYYKRLAANHRLHHYRNEHYWLGVTSNLGDRIMRTYPDNKSGVPLSDTARSL